MMMRDGARVRVLRARAELEQAEQRLAVRWQHWRERIRRHRLSMTIGGGLLGGFVFATVSPRQWSRMGAALFGGGAWLARSAVGPALLSALWTHLLSRHPSSGQSEVDAADSAPPNA